MDIREGINVSKHHRRCTRNNSERAGKDKAVILHTCDWM